MNQIARYSIVRFLPYAETEEFANVGVVLFAPGKRYFDFRLNSKWRRIGAFFEPLERRVFSEGIRDFGEELQRTRALAMDMLGDSRGQTKAAAVFEDLVRPREALFRFSSIRAIVTDAPEAKLAALFDHYVEHAFATHEYHEALIERAVRGVLRREGLGQRFRPAKLGTGEVRFGVPFAELDETGRARRVIKPMHLAHDDPIRILDHGSQWVGRLRHLERVRALPDALLLAITEPEGDGGRLDAYNEARRELQEAGAILVPAKDETRILTFARG
ncbi:MAG: DUF3037 domain-containing protein [Rhodocyclaceae bacterium]